MTQIKRMLLIGILVAVGSQFYVSFFVEGFIIALSVIILPLLLYRYQSLNPIMTCLITAVLSPLFRGVIEFTSLKDAYEALLLIWPEVFFYTTYGLIYYLVYTNHHVQNLTRFTIAIFMSDFFSNIIEMSIRTKLIELDMGIIKGLFGVAIARSLLVVFMIILFKRYQSFLVKEEHENRYRRLVVFTSNFKSEIYFMHKNMNEIERLMTKAFRAHRLSQKHEVPKEIQNLTLDLAKEVHEVKKDYIRVIKGLEEIGSTKLNITNMAIKDILDLLINNTKEYLRQEKLRITLFGKSYVNILVKDHYFLMSILRNLINNSIEACKNMPSPRVDIKILQKEDTINFVVSDNGKGIEESNIAYIFTPGFSTKFNEKTGDINRGVGLVIVKDIVEQHFKGTIKVSSKVGEGTTFSIAIPKNNLEGELN